MDQGGPGRCGGARKLAANLFADPLHNFARELVIAAVFNAEIDLVPQEREVAGIVKDWFLKYEAVGDVYDPAVVQVGVDPLADLHECRAQHADVDDVAFDAAQLDAIAGFVERAE